MRTRNLTSTATAAALAAVLALSGCSMTADPAATPTPDAAAGKTVAGTEAETWAEDEAGLTEPPATPPPGWDPAVYDLAVTTAREHLVAATLNPSVLYDGQIQPLIDAIRPQSRADVRASIESSGLNAARWLTRFSEGTQRDGPTKVTGVWTVTEETQDGRPMLLLEWRGTHVYPVADEQGQQTAVPVFRRMLWTWSAAGGWPAIRTNILAGKNVDVCSSLDTGRFAPDYQAADLADALSKPLGEGLDYDAEPPAPDCGATPAPTG